MQPVSSRNRTFRELEAVLQTGFLFILYKLNKILQPFWNMYPYRRNSKKLHKTWTYNINKNQRDTKQIQYFFNTIKMLLSSISGGYGPKRECITLNYLVQFVLVFNLISFNEIHIFLCNHIEKNRSSIPQVQSYEITQ